MKNTIKQKICETFASIFKDELVKTESLPQSGSYREYIRLIGKKISVIAVYNEDKKENNAFITFSNHFKMKGLPVPTIYFVSEENDFYIQEDLGSTCLFDCLLNEQGNVVLDNNAVVLYEKSIKSLIQFQLNAGQGLDLSACYPRKNFDKQSIMWDLNYFKYYFLKLAKIPFDEQLLEDDFNTFADFLLEAPNDYFLYRDFQSKNIMIQNGELFFIDYQGGRKGALQYDLASLLFDSVPDLSADLREQLLNFYIQELKKFQSVDEHDFKSKYTGFVLVRLMQAMGAYGFRGFFERKEHFLKSIPYAVKHVDSVLENYNIDLEINELKRVLSLLSKSEVLKAI